MDKRRLVFGAAVLFIVVGLLLACFSPGGWLNREKTETVLGVLTITTEKTSDGPMVGYVLLGLGGVGLVVAFAMKSRG